jgi:hypothetical protein
VVSRLPETLPFAKTAIVQCRLALPAKQWSSDDPFGPMITTELDETQEPFAAGSALSLSREAGALVWKLSGSARPQQSAAATSEYRSPSGSGRQAAVERQQMLAPLQAGGHPFEPGTAHPPDPASEAEPLPSR